MPHFTPESIAICGFQRCACTCTCIQCIQERSHVQTMYFALNWKRTLSAEDAESMASGRSESSGVKEECTVNYWEGGYQSSLQKKVFAPVSSTVWSITGRSVGTLRIGYVLILYILYMLHIIHAKLHVKLCFLGGSHHKSETEALRNNALNCLQKSLINTPMEKCTLLVQKRAAKLSLD